MSPTLRNFSAANTGTVTAPTLPVAHPAGSVATDLEIAAVNTGTSSSAIATLNVPSAQTKISAEQGTSNTSRLDAWYGRPSVSDLAATPTFTTSINSTKAGLVLSVIDGAFESIAQTAQVVAQSSTSQPVTPTYDDSLIVIIAALRGASASNYGLATPDGYAAAGATTTGVSGQGRTGIFAFVKKLTGQAGVQQPAATLAMTYASGEPVVNARFHVATIVIQPMRHGTAAGSVTWTGTPNGRARRRGTATGTVTWGGAPSGRTRRHGGSTGSVTWAGTPTGRTSKHATSAGSVTWAAIGPVGHTIHRGAASGTVTWTGTATGRAKRRGTATGSVTWAGQPTGHRPAIGVRRGTATGSVTWTAAAPHGRTTKHATATGQVTWSGAPSGRTVRRGTTTGGITWTAAARPGHAPVLTVFRGTTSGLLTWAAAPPFGRAPQLAHQHGAGTGTVAWVTDQPHGHHGLPSPPPDSRVLRPRPEVRVRAVQLEPRVRTVPHEPRTVTA